MYEDIVLLQVALISQLFVVFEAHSSMSRAKGMKWNDEEVEEKSAHLIQNRDNLGWSKRQMEASHYLL